MPRAQTHSPFWGVVSWGWVVAGLGDCPLAGVGVRWAAGREEELTLTLLHDTG